LCIETIPCPCKKRADQECSQIGVKRRIPTIEQLSDEERNYVKDLFAKLLKEMPHQHEEGHYDAEESDDAEESGDAEEGDGTEKINDESEKTDSGDMDEDETERGLQAIYDNHVPFAVPTAEYTHLEKYGADPRAFLDDQSSPNIPDI
jgi:hypothetical protein